MNRKSLMCTLIGQDVYDFGQFVFNVLQSWWSWVWCRAIHHRPIIPAHRYPELPKVINQFKNQNVNIHH